MMEIFKDVEHTVYTFNCTCSSMLHVNMIILYVVNPSATNTITVGRTDDPTTPITITPVSYTHLTLPTTPYV